MSDQKTPQPVDGWATLIGMNYGDGSSYAPLEGCVNDAIAFYILLTSPGYGNFLPGQVRLLLDGESEKLKTAVRSVVERLDGDYQISARPSIVDEIVGKRILPNRATILDEVYRAAHNANSNEAVMVFFAGHGRIFNGKHYLIPPESRPSSLSNTAIPLRRIKKELQQSRAQHKLLFLDVCYPGEPSATFAPPTHEQQRDILFAGADEIIMLTSCLPWEEAYEWDGSPRHGVFTYYLIGGLSGKADTGWKGYVTLDDIYRYVDREVKIWVANYYSDGTLQTPSMNQFGLERACNIVLSLNRNNSQKFFGREKELGRLRDCLVNRGCCQIVGPQLIGKTSLLRQIERRAPAWERDAVVVYLNLRDPRCSTLKGWLARVGRQFELSSPPQSLEEFADHIENLRRRCYPVLCLDEFEVMASRERRKEFNSNFYSTLRFCGQHYMSIVVASLKALRKLNLPNEPRTSPFPNILQTLDLGPFSDEDAKDFITNYCRDFADEEIQKILQFACGHPKALQVACDWRDRGGDIITALERAEEEMKELLPDGWRESL